MRRCDVEQLEQLEQSQAQALCDELNWDCAAGSHVGQVRKSNEDAFIRSPERKLWAVADGMGGFSRGDYASQAVVEALLYFSPQASALQNILDLNERLKHAHQICRNTFAGERVGSTVAALFSQGRFCFFLWAGDSRIYRLRNGTLEQMTRDHTVAQEKCARGELSPVQAAMHPSAHVLTRAIGVHQVMNVELHHALAQPNDRYLVCSDGLYNELRQQDIQALLAQGGPQKAVEALLARAVKQGGRDNVSVIVLDAKSAS